MKKRMIQAFLLMLAIPISFVFLTSMKTVTPTATNGDIKLTDLTFNRKAVQLTGDKKKEFPLTEQGFLWDSDDSKTAKFRPQGITTVKEGEKEFVIVSWYGKKLKDYQNRGARISIVDFSLLKSNPSVKNYRHILLVDKNHKPFYDKGLDGEKGTMHAGGIAYVNGKLHVADSRAAHRVIRVFDLNKIEKVDPVILKYSHVLVEEYNYKAAIKPSFLSYDKDRKEVLIGAFNKAPSDTKQNLITWFKPPMNATEAKAFDTKSLNIYRLPDKYKKIQGISSMKDPDDASKQILWLSTSFGRSARSNLYKLQIDGASKLSATSSSPTTATNPYKIVPIESSKGKNYPPGLEDCNISDDKQLWLLTEFHYMEGGYYPLHVKNKAASFPSKKTRRGVFAIDYNADIK